MQIEFWGFWSPIRRYDHPRVKGWISLFPMIEDIGILIGKATGTNQFEISMRFVDCVGFNVDPYRYKAISPKAFDNFTFTVRNSLVGLRDIMIRKDFLFLVQRIAVK